MTRTFKKKFSKSPGSFKNKSKNLSSRKSLINTNRPTKNSRKNKKKQMGGGIEGFTKMRSLDFLEKVEGYNKFEIGTLDVEHIIEKKVRSKTRFWNESVLSIPTSFKKHTLSYYYPHKDWNFLSDSLNTNFAKVKTERTQQQEKPDPVYLVLQKTTSNDEVYFCKVEPDYVIGTYNVISPYRIYFPKQGGQSYLCFNYPEGNNDTPKINLKVQNIELNQSEIRDLYHENFSKELERGRFYEGDWNDEEIEKIKKKTMKSNKGNSGGLTMDYQMSRNNFSLLSSLGFQLELFPLYLRYDIDDKKRYTKKNFVSKYLDTLKKNQSGLSPEAFQKLMKVELFPKETNEEDIRKKLGDWGKGNRYFLEEPVEPKPSMGKSSFDEDNTSKTLEENIKEKLGEIWSNSKRDLILKRYEGLNPQLNGTRSDKHVKSKTLKELLDEYGSESMKNYDDPSIGYNQALVEWIMTPDSRYDINDKKLYTKEDFVSKYLKILKGKKDGLTSKEFLELLGVELIPKELYENELFIRKKLEEIWSNSDKKELILQRYKKLNPRMDETRLDNYRAAKTLEEFLDNYGNESIGYNQALGKWLNAPGSNTPSSVPQ